MTASISADNLPTQIQELLDQRQQHTQAIRQIDETLAKVTAALGGPSVAAMLIPPPATTATVGGHAPAAKAKTGRRSKFSVSAADLVLKFVQERKNPTTREITQYLLSQGRKAGAVSNALSVLTSARKLKRKPLGKGIMGSTYSIA